MTTLARRRAARRALYVANVIVTVGVVLFLAWMLTGCGAARSQPYYLSTPVVAPDGVTVHFDDRTVLWMDGYLTNARLRNQEMGACLHIARDSANQYWVDSVEAPADYPGNGVSNWAETAIVCPPETAPLHYHVVEPSFRPWLAAHFTPALADSIENGRCTLSDQDQSDFAARYPFVVMQCGMGEDSIVVRHVRKRR